MESKKSVQKREEKLWSEVKNYQVATNNARILGVLDELIINDKTGKIVDIAIKVEVEGVPEAIGLRINQSGLFRVHKYSLYQQ